MTRPRNPGATTADAPVRAPADAAVTDPGPPPDVREHPSSGRVATARTESLPLIPFRSFAAEVRVREVDSETTPAALDLRGLALPNADDLAARQHASARPLPKPVDNYHTIPDAKVLLNVTQPPPPSSRRVAPSPALASAAPMRRPTERMADVPREQVAFRERERNQRYVPTGPRLHPLRAADALRPAPAQRAAFHIVSLRGLLATLLVGAAVVVVLSVFVVRRSPTGSIADAAVAPAPSPQRSAFASSTAATAAATATLAPLASPAKPPARPAKPVHAAPKRVGAPPLDF